MCTVGSNPTLSAKNMKKSLEIFCLHWDNIDPRMMLAHKAVMQHFEIPVTYHGINMDHGTWMTKVMEVSEADIVAFIEPDCIPLNKTKFFECVHYAIVNDTFCGIAQASNHLEPKNHIYAAPGFFVITKSAYAKLDRPSFMCTVRGYTGEEVSWAAEAKGFNYRVILPTHYEKPSKEGIWNLGPLGYYGIGTVFDDTVYHLYQGRYNDNVELFVKRCKEVIAGTFSTSGFKQCMTLTGE
jgi:hypothetical protein